MMYEIKDSRVILLHNQIRDIAGGQQYVLSGPTFITQCQETAFMVSSIVDSFPWSGKPLELWYTEEEILHLRNTHHEIMLHDLNKRGHRLHIHFDPVWSGPNKNLNNSIKYIASLITQTSTSGRLDVLKDRDGRYIKAAGVINGIPQRKRRRSYRRPKDFTENMDDH